MGGEGLTFGAFVRRERGAREIGLRERAGKIGVSPTACRKSSGTSSCRRSRAPFRAGPDRRSGRIRGGATRTPDRLGGAFGLLPGQGRLSPEADAASLVTRRTEDLPDTIREALARRGGGKTASHSAGLRPSAGATGARSGFSEACLSRCATAPFVPQSPGSTAGPATPGVGSRPGMPCRSLQIGGNQQQGV